MIAESDFKKKFLEKLNDINTGWVDGDKEKRQEKKADVVNHELSIAIEIKDEDNYKIIPDGRARVTDLNLMNQRLSNQIKSANNKFKEYPDYKTLVLFRTEYIASSIKYAIEGLDQYGKKPDGSLFYMGKTGKYSKFAKHEVGGFLIFTDKAYYFTNYLAKQERVIDKSTLEALTDLKLEDL